MIKNRIIRSTVFLLFCVSFVFAQIPEGYEAGINTISGKEIYDNIKFLASDSLKGRSAGSDENNVAAKYIASKFKEYGLKPLFEDVRRKRFVEDSTDADQLLPIEPSSDSYFQKFSFKRSKLSDNNLLAITSVFPDGSYEVNYKFGVDFLIQYASVPKNLKLDLPIVFAGYGIEKGESGYNDFFDASGKEISVKNKIVLIVDGFPLERDSGSAFSKSRNAQYRNPLRKAEVAAEKGAAALLVIGSPFKVEPPFNIKYQNLAKSFKRQFDYLAAQKSSSIPIMFISPTVLDEIFKNSGKNLENILEEIERDLKPQAFEFQTKRVNVEINFDTEIINTQNVVGFIEGTDPVLKDELIVLGAHYDHIGFGYYGAMSKSNAGEIHNGADDNASGTCGLIELAEAFSKSKPKRSLLFVAFSAEENGLLGSRYYIQYQPLKQLEKTVAMLNFDMIGRNEPELLWIGAAFYGEDIRNIVEKANKDIGFELLYNTGLLSFASDQAFFLKKEIPSAFFFAGLHDDYHTPFDDVEKINPAKIERVTKLGFLTGWIIANQESKPKYRELTPDERKELIRISLERQKKVRPKNLKNN